MLRNSRVGKGRHELPSCTHATAGLMQGPVITVIEQAKEAAWFCVSGGQGCKVRLGTIKLCRSCLLSSSRRASLPACSQRLHAEVTTTTNRAEGVDVTAPACGTRQASMPEYWLALSVAADCKTASQKRCLKHEHLSRAMVLTAVCGRSPGSSAGLCVHRHRALASRAAGDACPGTGGAGCDAGQI